MEGYIEDMAERLSSLLLVWYWLRETCPLKTKTDYSPTTKHTTTTVLVPSQQSHYFTGLGVHYYSSFVCSACRLLSYAER